MKTISTTISRDCGHTMRGLAIIAIALHNFCHVIPHTVQENEFEFHRANAERLINHAALSWPSVYDFLSFFGWYGVPAFMFLTGYGLVMKYERGGTPFSRGSFLKANWIKLLLLMLPGVLALLISTLCRNLSHGAIGWAWLFRDAFQITMIPDLIYPWYPPSPGIYWYFGLAMQFYIVYALAIHRRPAWWMAVLVAASLGLQWAVSPESLALTWIRHNSTGWMLLLVAGVLWGRNPELNRNAAIAIFAASVLLFLPSMANAYTWQLSILCAVGLLFLSAKVSLKIPVWREIWIWVGKLSPFIFAAHPLVRMWTFTAFPQIVKGPGLLAGYLAAVIITAIIYRFVWQKIGSLIAKK